MDLSSILDDIQDGAVKPSEDVLLTTPLVVKDNALEHLLGLKVVVDKAKELGEYVNMKRIVQEALVSPTLDKVTALELFTMLPTTSSDSSLLTSAPSLGNKTILERVYSKSSDRSDELSTMNYEVNELVGKSLEAGKDIVKVGDEYITCIMTHLRRLEEPGPIIVVDGVGMNVLDMDIFRVSCLDTHALCYPPYEHTLDVKFRELSQNADFLELLDKGILLKSSEQVISLRQTALFIVNVCEQSIKSYEELTRVNEELSKLSQNKKLPYNQTLIDTALEKLKELSANQHLLKSDGCLGDKVITCLSLLT